MNLIKQAQKVLNEGGTILVLTDTIWGISADALNEKAVDQVFKIKRRPTNKSLIVLVSSLKMLASYVEEIPKLATQLIKESKGPTSIIYPRGKNLAKYILADNGSVAIRIVSQGFCFELIEALGRPIISTSANISGEESPQNFSEINSSIKEEVDFCVPNMSEANIKASASSIYLIENDTVIKLR